MSLNGLINKNTLEDDYGIKKTEIALFEAFGLPSARFDGVRVFDRKDVEQFLMDNPSLHAFLQKRLDVRSTGERRGGRPRKAA